VYRVESAGKETPGWLLAMTDALSQTLRTHFGFDRFLSGQREAIEHLLACNSHSAGRLGAYFGPRGWFWRADI